jgi:hypothetical protein
MLRRFAFGHARESSGRVGATAFLIRPCTLSATHFAGGKLVVAPHASVVAYG